MSEFCAGVKILLERMKSNPEDFELLEYDVPNMIEVKGKFFYFGKNMEQMIAGPNKQGVLENWGEWHYFTKEEQDALITGFKEMKRAKFDKETMERVFDETYVQRQREHMMRMMNRPMLQPKHVQQVVQPFQTMTTTTTDNTGGGLMNAIGLGGIFGGGR